MKIELSDVVLSIIGVCILGIFIIGELALNPLNDFTIQDVCLDCNEVYGSERGYCINEFVLLSQEQTELFCKSKGFATGWISSLTCNKGLTCTRTVFSDGVYFTQTECLHPQNTDFLYGVD
jgi:hypothetical protein